MSEAIAEKPEPKKVAAKKVATKVAAKKVAKKAADKIDPVDAWMERVVENFRTYPKDRPTSRSRLRKKVGNLIGKPATGPEVQAVIERMETASKLKFVGRDVPEYHLK